ncbi:MAG: asparagine synthase (glutamine-hydrolyzing) [Bacilli bacterium]|nr:asparagine synthase (glutamine-hydrolyzing) [Bacilli bacterium]MDD4808647.1 asparagine synthase (glutamine-hydrolyzing) [Bacilli bacterium]
MCGIVGFIDKKETKEKNKIIKKMSEKIIHRGPDSEGFYVDEIIALGHRRLNVLDLETGDQPIYNEKKDKLIIFNGEIYNFQELRKELKKKKYKFITNSDTEVILHGYEEYGARIVNKLRGQFAFVIWDIKKKELFGARDHFGMKPFYYAKMDDTFIFGSEIKSFIPHPNFKKEINKDALKPYLTFQYSVLEETFFKNVYKLLPGHYFTYKKGQMKIKKYYEIEFKEQNKPIDKYMEEIEKVVKESVKYHKVSDVPVGSFLSGGVDSSYITTLLKPNKNFSVGFENKGFSEVNYAKELSDLLKIENVNKIIKADEFFDKLELVQYHSDEPHANLSAVPLYFLSELTKDHVTVVLSGEGADELFGGYTSYSLVKEDKMYRKVPKFIRYSLGKIANSLPTFHGKHFLVKNGLPIEDYYVGQAFIFDDKEAKKIVTEPYKHGPNFKEITKPIFDKVKNKDDVTKMQYLDMHLWLPHDILLKADKMTMAHSIEVRAPLLDIEVMKIASKIPTNYKISHGTTKYIFRECTNKELPEEWAKRPKLGFPVPFTQWIKEDKYYNLIKKEFTQSYTKEFFNQDEILKLLEDHYHNKTNNGRKIWTIYAFLLWYKVYFLVNK